MEIKLSKAQEKFIFLFKKAMLNELKEFKFAQHRVREGGISIFLFKNKPQKDKLPTMAAKRVITYPVDLLVNFEVDKPLYDFDSLREAKKRSNVKNYGLYTRHLRLFY